MTTSSRATRAVLLLCALSLAALALASPAGATLRRHSLPHATDAARACRHAKHPRRCRAALARKRAHRKHKPSTSAKPTAPKSATKGSPTAPWATVPPSLTPGATPGTGTSSPAAGAPPAETPAAPARVEVTAEDTKEFSFVLSRPSVPTGKVIVEFVNHGQDEHNLHALEPAESTEVGSIPNTPSSSFSGQHPNPTLTLDLHAGSYNFFCSLPGHEAKGMKATLKVE